MHCFPSLFIQGALIPEYHIHFPYCVLQNKHPSCTLKAATAVNDENILIRPAKIFNHGTATQVNKILNRIVHTDPLKHAIIQARSRHP